MSYTTVRYNTGAQPLVWVDIVKPTRANQKKLLQSFPLLHEKDVEEAFLRTLRTKIVKRDHAIFLVIMVPQYEKKSRSISVHEVDFFVGENFLITIHEGTLKPLQELFARCRSGEAARAQIVGKGADDLLAAILNDVLQYAYPLIDSINDELDKLKLSIFNGRNTPEIVQEILLIRRNITDLRKAMRGHATVLRHLIKPDTHEGARRIIQSLAPFEELIDYSEEIWGVLESNKELVDALKDTNEALISHAINNIMKTLTAVSVILLPANLVASIFGMNAVYPPLLGQVNDFWMVSSLIVSISICMLVFLWWKRWLK